MPDIVEEALRFELSRRMLDALFEAVEVGDFLEFNFDGVGGRKTSYSVPGHLKDGMYLVTDKEERWSEGPGADIRLKLLCGTEGKKIVITRYWINMELRGLGGFSGRLGSVVLRKRNRNLRAAS